MGVRSAHPQRAVENQPGTHHPNRLGYHVPRSPPAGSPATVAGRIRYERQNYRLLSQFVGTGKVRTQFGISG